MRKTLSIIVLMLAMAGVWAAPIHVETARRAAENFMKLHGSTAVLTDITASTPFSQFYVFAGADGQGFVLVSADDCVIPVIGYSATNPFTAERMPEHIKAWLDECESQIRFYSSRKEASAPDARNQWQRLLAGQMPTVPTNANIAPLLSTTWNQNPYYNEYCPYDGNASVHCVTGCVATATAQVMKYWNYPAQGYGSHSYTHSVYGLQSADFSATTYDWAAMPDHLDYNSTPAQMDAVAALMQQLGVALEMDYSPWNSSAYTFAYGGIDFASAQNALRQYFKYRSDLYYISLSDFTDSEWASRLTHELQEGRPILYDGRQPSGGHCFVCDGVDNSGLFHFNWGWGGFCDGFYAIGHLDPADGSYSSGSTFNLENRALMGIQPNPDFGDTSIVSATSSDPAFGSVSGSGTFTGVNTTGVFMTASSNTGYRFTQWENGTDINPRMEYVNGGTYNYTADFEPLTGDTLYYCHDLFVSDWGFPSGTTFKWGIRLPASTMNANQALTHVMLYVVTEGTYTLKIYQGTRTRQVHTQTFTTSPDSLFMWNTIPLTAPVIVDSLQPIWISFSCNSGYPATLSYYGGNDDSRLFGEDFSPLPYEYSFMIKAIFSHRDADDDLIVADVPWSDDFEGAGFPFQTLDADHDGSCWTLCTLDSAAHTGTHALLSTAADNGETARIDNYLISPRFTIPENGSLTFFARTATADGLDTISVKMAIDGYSGPASFTTLLQPIPYHNTTYSRFTVSLGGLAGRNAYFAIEHRSGNGGSLIIDDFSVGPYTINAHAVTDNPSVLTGTVSGSGAYNYLDTVTLAAYPEDHYHFSHWNDGVTDNPRHIVVTGDAVYFAYFAIDTIFIQATSADPLRGTVTGGGPVPYGSIDTLNAIAEEGFHFSCWNNGSRDNPYIISAIQDTALQAIFLGDDVPSFEITTRSNNDGMGHVTGSGSYEAGSLVWIRAIPAEGCQFLHWGDSRTTETERLVVVEDTATYTAYFVPEQCRINTLVNIARAGTATGDGLYRYGDVCTLTATARDGFRFDHWDNGSTEAVRIIDIDEQLCGSLQLEAGIYSITFTAYFEAVQGIENADGDQIEIYTEHSTIVVSGAVNDQVRIYDITGRLLYENLSAGGFRFGTSAPGVYFVKVGNRMARKVVIK